MKEHICEVVPVYVRPQLITDEKACIGVIVRCPETGFADYRLIDCDTPAFVRIVNFFPRFGKKNLMRAIEWAKDDISYSIGGPDNGDGDVLFANLIRPRENVVQYGAPQTHAVQMPSEEIDRAYRAVVM